MRVLHTHGGLDRRVIRQNGPVRTAAAAPQVAALTVLRRAVLLAARPATLHAAHTALCHAAL